MEDTQPITTKDLVYMSDSTYTRGQIRETELQVTSILQFRLCHVTTHHFVDRFIRASDGCTGCLLNGAPVLSPRNLVLEFMTAYLLEMALLSPELSAEAEDGAGPSRTAASAVYLARATVGVRDLEGCIWGDTMRYYTGYSADDLSKCFCVHSPDNTILSSCQ